MKTNLLLLLLIGVFISVNASAAPLRNRPINIEQETQMERSATVKFHGFLSNSSLIINSSMLVENLSLTITNMLTNEVVYAETYSTFSETSIDISLFTAGDYRLQLTLDSVMYLGNFSIY